jgi:hypothetical protein
MRYQQLKIRDVGRLALIGVPAVAAAVAVVVFRDSMRVDIFGVIVLLGILAVIAIPSLGMAVFYLVTSPAQNAAQIRRSGVEAPEGLIDESDPDYATPTWRYWLWSIR